MEGGALAIHHHHEMGQGATLTCNLRRFQNSGWLLFLRPADAPSSFVRAGLLGGMRDDGEVKVKKEKKEKSRTPAAWLTRSI